MADSGEEFSGTMKSIGNDLLALIKTIVEERRRREREARAQEAAEAKEKAGLERDAKIRAEEREFMKAENEKMRTEMREMLKANGMEVSDKNMELTREHGEKMMANEEKIAANDRGIENIDKKLQDIDQQLDGHLNPKPGPDGRTPEPNLEAAQKLQTEANNLVQMKAGLQDLNRGLEAENIMLKNGKGLEQLQTDIAVKNDLAKQLDQVNAGIARDKKNIDYANERIPKIEKDQADLLKSPKPDMDKWEKLQAEKEGLQKERGLSQEGLAKKEGQLKELKQGKTLEQMEKAAKLESGIKQGKQEVEGLDNAIKGYEKKEKELMDAGKKPGDPELDSVQKRKQALSEKKQEAQKEVTKLERELDGVNKGVEGVGKVKMEPKGPLSQGPQLISEAPIGPSAKLEGVGKAKVEPKGPLSQGPELGESPIGPKVGQDGGRKWRPGSVGDTLNKEGYKVGQGPKIGQRKSIGV